MPLYRSTTVQRFLDYIPGKQRLGVYRFLPFFFVLGAALEFSMINWRVGDVNFYTVYKRRRVQELALEQLKEEGKIE